MTRGGERPATQYGGNGLWRLQQAEFVGNDFVGKRVSTITLMMRTMAYHLRCLEEKDVVSSVATVLADLRSRRKLMTRKMTSIRRGKLLVSGVEE